MKCLNIYPFIDLNALRFSDLKINVLIMYKDSMEKRILAVRVGDSIMGRSFKGTVIGGEEGRGEKVEAGLFS